MVIFKIIFIHFFVTALRKKALAPQNLKPLFWTRIIAPKPTELVESEAIEKPVSATPAELWQEIDEADLDNLEEFTEMFSRQAVMPKKVKTEVKPAKIQTIKVLDSKRSQSVGIFARSLHLDFAEIERAIYFCDTSVVSMETLQQLMNIKSTPDEIASIKEAAATQTDAPLDAPEQFLLKISNISCATERIHCILFQADFDEAYNLIARKIDLVTQLCEFLTENEYLKLVFSIILTLGNYMNAGNRTRGQADGFGLEILNRLKDVKSKDLKLNLLHFIVRTYIAKCRKDGTPLNEIRLPVPDASDISKCLSIDFGELKDQMEHLKRKLEGKYSIYFYFKFGLRPSGLFQSSLFFT